MSSVAVTKLHGTFNDFVVLDQRNPAQSKVADLSAFARKVCDRRGGVGADGLLVLLAADRAYARMRVINADGSEAEMCGNGMRCAIRYLSERGEGEHFEIETLAGIIVADVLEKGEAYEIRLNLGTPAFEQRELPFPNASYVRMGNPHVVIFEDSLDAIDLIAVGRQMSDVNVHLAVPVDRHRIDVRHHERGVGMTYACGTGAASAAVAAIERGIADSPVDVHVPGGRLRIEWDGSNEVFLTGPAVRVFDAEVEDVRAVPV
jgi:diaminopimelate epimerase